MASAVPAALRLAAARASAKGWRGSHPGCLCRRKPSGRDPALGQIPTANGRIADPRSRGSCRDRRARRGRRRLKGVRQGLRARQRWRLRRIHLRAGRPGTAGSTRVTAAGGKEDQDSHKEVLSEKAPAWTGHCLSQPGNGNKRTSVNRAVLVRARAYRPRYVDVSRCAGWQQHHSDLRPGTPFNPRRTS